jgi:dethiobiotin synthetase
LNRRFLLVTGTDTGAGKTVVACALARALTARGRRVVAIKPVESGCAGGAGEDGVRLAAATGQREPRAALVRLAEPVAPPVAAEREAVELRPHAWEEAARGAAAASDLVMLEGAGGLLSPLAWGYDARDLARALGAGGGRVAALVVAPDRLGTLSHCRLVAEALGNGGVVILGFVLVAPEAGDGSTGRNAEALERCGVGPVATLARLTDPAAVGASHVASAAAWVEAWLGSGRDRAT